MENINKDWIGNTQATFVTLGATNHSQSERESNDFYATEPKAIKLLMEVEKFNHNIWECCCGTGHLSEAMKELGYNVISSDLIDRGYGKGGVDFLQCNKQWKGDIITNPPYKFANQFIVKSLELLQTGNKLAMFLPIRYLEGKARRKIFEENPPEVVYISSGRIVCAINGDFKKVKGSAMSYAWFIWKKGYKGETKLRWFN